MRDAVVTPLLDAALESVRCFSWSGNSRRPASGSFCLPRPVPFPHFPNPAQCVNPYTT